MSSNHAGCKGDYTSFKDTFRDILNDFRLHFLIKMQSNEMIAKKEKENKCVIFSRILFCLNFFLTIEG